MKNALETWKWSLGVMVRSPLVIIALAAVAAAWGFGAYQWLYFPTESSGRSFVVGFLWAVTQWAVLAAFLAASVSCANNVAPTGAKSMSLRSLRAFSLRQLLRCAAFVIFAALPILLLQELFQRLNNYALEVASFLTYHSEKAVRPETVERIFQVIEWLVWIAAAGFLIGFVSILVPQGWRSTARSTGRLFANACWRAPFLTTLLSFLVFGGCAYLLANWHPKVSPGSADYAQAFTRLGVAILLILAGWLWWLLSLARLNEPAREKAPT